MKKASRKIVVTLALLGLLAAGSNFAQAQKTTKPSSQPVAGSTPTAMQDVARLQATADQAASRIQASPSDKSALIDVVRTKNIDRASALLLKNGFTSKQLEGARIELVDHTGGGSGGAAMSKVKVTIRVSCCPMSITITISF